MNEQTVAVLEQATRSAWGADALTLTDRELLRRFADTHDEAAFAALVARHARMVLGACRRVLPTVQDAEDACQATFLILARKAAGPWQPSAANWLYTTARRVASRAQRAAVRRAKRESRAAHPEAISPLDEITGRELLSALDEELARLPVRYREPLVLCYLEGLSRDEIAARLAIPAGTVKTRLERGRKRLADALSGRGVGLGLGLLTLAVCLPAAATPQLAETVRAAVAGPTPAVAALARETGMSTTLRTLLVATVAAVGLGIAWAATATEPSKNAPPATVAVSTTPAVQQPDAQFQKDVVAAREKAVRFLKKQQQADGTWEGIAPNLLLNMDGGATALVTLALLEAGVPANDPALAKAIAYLAELPPKRTYVVSLQTQVLAKADAKKHAVVIQTNTDWLTEKAIGFQTDRELQGWSYPGNAVADGSNTHFAVVGLHAAARAGAKVDKAIWAAIREHYIRTQHEGGWTYHGPKFGSSVSSSMTAAGLVGLAIAAEHDPDTPASKDAFEKGMKRFLTLPDDNTKSLAYLGMVTAELGRATKTPAFKSGDRQRAWYREGAERLVKDQKPDGSWVSEKGLDSYHPVLTTAFSLYFLGPPPKN